MDKLVKEILRSEITNLRNYAHEYLTMETYFNHMHEQYSPYYLKHDCILRTEFNAKRYDNTRDCLTKDNKYSRVSFGIELDDYRQNIISLNIMIIGKYGTNFYYTFPHHTSFDHDIINIITEIIMDIANFYNIDDKQLISSEKIKIYDLVKSEREHFTDIISNLC